MAIVEEWSNEDVQNYQVGQKPIDIIDGYVSANALTTLYGAPDTGKSFAAIDMCFAVAMGTSWCGSEVDIPGNTAMFALEYDQENLFRRIQAYAQYHNIDLGNLPNKVYWLGSKNEIKLPADEVVLTSYIQTRKLKLCILDTLATVMEGSENDPEDMSAVVNSLARIAGVTECAIVAIHHTPKTTGKDATPRGHSSIMGKSRSQVLLTKEKGKNGKIKQTKANERADDIQGKGYRIQSIILGKDFKNRDLDIGVFELCDVLEGLPEGTHKYTSKQIGETFGLKPTATKDLIKKLIGRDLIEQHGKGPATYYTSTLTL